VRSRTSPARFVALLDGPALGGGLELALACDYRLATARARFALPEIKLGLVPGAGGTVRLPRLIGLRPALRLICTGNSVEAPEALALGLVDAVLDPGDTDEQLARWLRAHPAKRRVSALAPAPADGEPAAAFDDLAARLRSKAPNARAFAACVELVRANLDRTAAECERAETQAFAALAASPEAAAQRYLFAATAAAKRANRQLPGTAAPVARVGVVGAGTMGLGIARAVAQAGLPATVVEPDDAARARAQGLLEAAATKYPPKAGEPGLLSLVTWGSSLDAMGECDVVIEAVYEDIDVKREVFDRLAEISNTSYLEVERIAAVVPDPGRVLGMHFFSPAHAMRLVEVVRARQTGDDALRTAVNLATALGKIPVVVRSSYGFVGNRMLARRSAQADALLLGGARPEQVDSVLTGFGFPMGPFAMADLAGLDVSWRNRQANGVVAPAADRLVEKGRLGQKAGRGFFRYQGRVGQPDPEVKRIIDQVAAERGVTRRELSDTEVLDRLLLPMVDEAAQILDEGVVARASDIDVVWANGYGWPKVRGGPVFWAERRGLAEVVKRLDELAELTGDATLRASGPLRERAAT